MLEIVDKITIKSTPDKVYNTLVFFFQSTEHYKLWHKDHISCRWKKGKDFSTGSILIAKEYIHGTIYKLGFSIIRCEQNSGFKYKMLFPFSIICSGGSFKMVSKGTDTEMLAQLNFRFGFLLKVFFKNTIESLQNHMKEEGLNIKEMIEKGQVKL